MKTKSSNLIILIPGFPQDEHDSTCLPAQQNFVRAFNRYLPEVSLTILSFQYPFESKEYWWHGNRVIAFGGKNKGGISKFLLRQKIVAKLKELDSEEKISGILNFWAGECALIGDHFGKKYFIPCYTWIMGQDAKKNNGYIRKFKPNSDSLIAISDFIQLQFEANHQLDPRRVIPLGIDLPKNDPIDERNIDILSAGSLIPLKNFDQTIEVVYSCSAVLPNLKATIVGSGPDKKRLHSIIKKYNLEARIEMPGELPHQKLLQLMTKSKILVHPSSYEGFSGVCLEALAKGMQVVSYCQPMNDQIPNWHIVKDLDQMKSKCIELLSTPTDFIPSTPYTMEKTVRTIAKLYHLTV